MCIYIHIYALRGRGRRKCAMQSGAGRGCRSTQGGNKDLMALLHEAVDEMRTHEPSPSCHLPHGRALLHVTQREPCRKCKHDMAVGHGDRPALASCVGPF